MRIRNVFLSSLSILIFLGMQVMFWQKSRHIYPSLEIVNEPPKASTIKGLSLGDTQFYFRILAFQLQNFGDTFGRTTPLKNYDFQRLLRWFFLMDELDPKSNLVPATVAYYYSASQNPSDCKYTVEYLEKHSERDINKKWWWMSQAVYLANSKLKDKPLALRLAYKLAEARGDNLPAWVRQMPAFIHEQMGDNEQAFAIIDQILKDAKKGEIESGEMNFMRYFIEDRLKKMVPEAFEEKRSPNHDIPPAPSSIPAP